MKRLFFFVFSLIGILPNAISQTVENKAFERRLAVLLSHNVEEIGVKEAAQKKNVIFLDARERNEYEVSHVKGAKWIGYDDFNPARIKGIDKDAEIIVYCSVGYRSEKITKRMNKLGYKNVSNLYGGIFEWVNQDNSIVDSKSKVTDKIHTYNEKWSRWVTKGDKVW